MNKNRRIRPLTAADLPKLPEPCARCTFWESSLTDLASSDGPRDRVRVKSEWAEAVTERWGYCGVQASDNGNVVGYLTMAPAVLVPRLGAFATTPVSQDAAVLMSVRVIEEYRGFGIGRQLTPFGSGGAGWPTSRVSRDQAAPRSGNQASVVCRSIRSRGVMGWGRTMAKPTDSSQLVGSMHDGPSW